MTYKEMVKRANPEALDTAELGGVKGCPANYFTGAPSMLDNECLKGDCNRCWNSEMPGTTPTTAKVIYLAGPITGVPDYWRAFAEGANKVEAAGYIPLTPTALPYKLGNQKAMQICLAMINTADAVLFLPGWSRSVGAQIEMEYCKYIGKPHATTIEALKEVLI